MEIETSSAETDHHCWASSLIIGALLAGLAMIYSLVLAGLIFHQRFWFAPGDVWMLVDGGRFVWNGALGYVYQGTGSYALPLSFILAAPVSGLVDHYHLLEGYPLPVRYPSAWLVVGPYALSVGVFVLQAVRRLAWELGVRRRLVALQLVAAAAVVVPVLEWGHFEDALAMVFVLHAVRRLVQTQYLTAAVFISLAVASKQWAIPLIALVVSMSPPGRRLRTLAAATAIPGGLALFTLAVDWTDTSRALFSPVNLAPDQTQGHVFFDATWLGSGTSALTRTLGLMLACALAWRLRRAHGPVQVLVAIAAILSVRILDEAISYSYYWAPALLVAGLVGLAAHQRVRVRDWLLPIAVILWASPRGNFATADLWWCGEAILLGLTVLQVYANATGRELRQTPAVLVKKLQQRPIFKAMLTARAAGETSWIQ